MPGRAFGQAGAALARAARLLWRAAPGQSEGAASRSWRNRAIRMARLQDFARRGNRRERALDRSRLYWKSSAGAGRIRHLGLGGVGVDIGLFEDGWRHADDPRLGGLGDLAQQRTGVGAALLP